ncbi:GNAT family N-acetyltransferase [Paenibacillus sepulcri]|uniref:GNAT family N-acetyltransferase n=1 Tax=Paenibacillus sepulcri TaxID=359917 RepID=A0ABS7C5H7_9BACL|nr:GNAT family N-acetyltransferase [Paenibacillus sepulcri]
MEIRVLEPADAEIYRELRLNSLVESPESFLTTYEIEGERPIEQTRQRLQAADSIFTLGAFKNHDLIGVVTFVRESHIKTAHKGNVYAMYVSPEYRGQGIGKALVNELLRKAKNGDGLEQVNLTVNSSNTQAKRMYESIGFATYGTERNASKWKGQYWDEDLMVIKL